MLFLPTTIGGLAALVGGYLTDRLGRQRVLVWSIVLYGIAAFCSAFATSLAELIFWRCITVAGACMEFVAAIAWLTELFPDTRRREAVLGFRAGVRHGRQFHDRRRLLRGGDLGRPAAGDPRRTFAVALCIALGALPAIPLILHAPLPARIAACGKRSAPRARSAPQLSRTVRAAAAPRDPGHHRLVGLLLRAGLRHAAAHSTRGARTAAGGRAAAQAAGAMGDLGAPARRISARCSGACCSPAWWCGS